MMVEFINGLTGTRMWVAPERETEYLAAGHIRAEGPPAAPAQQAGSGAQDTGGSAQADGVQNDTNKEGVFR